MAETFGCAIAQLNSVLYDKGANLKRTLQTMEDAARLGTRLIVFPELYLTGYFLQERVAEVAETADGPSLTRLAQAAQKLRMVTIIGFPEAHSGSIYNSAAVIDSTGEIKGTFRKVHLYDWERKHFHAGEEYPVFETTVGLIGVLVCFDSEFPEAPRSLALSGAQTIVTIAANMVPYQKHQQVYIRARALENHVWHVFANRVGIEETTIFFGQSGIADPLGKIVVEAGEREGLFYGLIDQSRIRDSYLNLDYLANRRPETYGDLVTPSASKEKRVLIKTQRSDGK
jgi:predicted amidohydrolase